MAKQVINVGTVANDNTGDPIRDAFIKTMANFDELYTDDAGDVNSVNAGTGISVNSTTGAVTVTNSLPDQTVALTGGTSITTSGTYPNFTITNDAPNATHTGEVTGSGALTITNDAVTADKLANSINAEIAANTAKTGITSSQASAITANTSKVTNATHTGDVTGSGALTIGNDKVTFATLENRYTALSALGSGSSFALNFLTATTFTATATGAATFTFSNAVQGQVIDLIITGDYALTFAETGSTFNKVGSTSYAGASTNLIQIVCTKDTSGSRIYHYSIATFAAAQPQ